MPMPDSEKQIPDDLDLTPEDVPGAPKNEAENMANEVMELQQRQVCALEQIAFAMRFYMQKKWPNFQEAFDKEFPEEDGADPEGADPE